MSNVDDRNPAGADRAMTRSEEQLNVGVQVRPEARHPAGDLDGETGFAGGIEVRQHDPNDVVERGNVQQAWRCDDRHDDALPDGTGASAAPLRADFRSP